MAAKDGIVGIYPVLRRARAFNPYTCPGLTPDSGPFAALYETFHYLAPPRPQDLSCTVIHALGDKFDFLAYYSDFRIDGQEASSPSDGPIGGSVTGIGDTKHAQTKPILESRCTGGQFQLGLFQPIFVGANEMQESPPDNAPVGNPRNIASYTRPLAQATPDGKPRPYNYRRRASRSRNRTPLVGVCGRPREWPDDLARSVAPLGSRIGGARRVSVLAASRGFHPRWKRVARQSRRHVHPIARWLFGPRLGLLLSRTLLDGIDRRRRGARLLHREAAGADRHGRKRTPDLQGPANEDYDSRRHRRGGCARTRRQSIPATFQHRDRGDRRHGRGRDCWSVNRATRIRRQWIDYWAITTGRRASMTVNPH